MTFYNGMNEYRWARIQLTQGHYPLHKNIQNAIANVKTEANKSGDAIIIQRWKPKGKQVYVVRPMKMRGWSKKTIISYYKDQGYDVDYIKSKNYVLK